MNRWSEMRFRAEPLEEEDARRYDALLRSQSHRFEVEHDVEHDEPEELSAFMAEVSEYMPQYGLTAAMVSKFIGAAFTEANLVEYMADKGRGDLEMFIQEIARDGSR